MRACRRRSDPSGGSSQPRGLPVDGGSDPGRPREQRSRHEDRIGWGDSVSSAIVPALGSGVRWVTRVASAGERFAASGGRVSAEMGAERKPGFFQISRSKAL